MEKMTKEEGMTPEEYRAMVEESDARVYKSQMNAYKEKYLALLKANTELEEENKKLKEKVKTLELWLDNKEKLNEEYRDKIDLLKYQSYGPSELADSLYDANKTIEKLKEELDKLRTDNIYEEGLYD